MIRFQLFRHRSNDPELLVFKYLKKWQCNILTRFIISMLYDYLWSLFSKCSVSPNDYLEHLRLRVDPVTFIPRKKLLVFARISHIAAFDHKDHVSL